MKIINSANLIKKEKSANFAREINDTVSVSEYY